MLRVVSEVTDERWAHTLGHLLWEVSARTMQRYDAEVSKADSDVPLSSSTIGLLDAIASQPGTTIATIARHSPKTPQAVSQVVARLDKLGLIERRLAGGRAIGLHITPKGTAVRAAGNAAEDAFEAQLEDALGTKRYDELRRLLDETRTVLKSLDGPSE
jgi:DNA-binding MarR family transcriptional regulator